MKPTTLIALTLGMATTGCGDFVTILGDVESEPVNIAPDQMPSAFIHEDLDDLNLEVPAFAGFDSDVTILPTGLAVPFTLAPHYVDVCEEDLQQEVGKTPEDRIQGRPAVDPPAGEFLIVTTDGGDFMAVEPVAKQTEEDELPTFVMYGWAPGEALVTVQSSTVPGLVVHQTYVIFQ